jgi:hypothetical protein
VFGFVEDGGGGGFGFVETVVPPLTKKVEERKAIFAIGREHLCFR